MPPKKQEKFLVVTTAAGSRVVVNLDRVEQVAYETVRGVFHKHLVLRFASGNVALANDENERVLEVLNIKDFVDGTQDEKEGAAA